MTLTLGFTALTLAFLSALYAAMTALLAANRPEHARWLHAQSITAKSYVNLKGALNFGKASLERGIAPP